MGAASAPGSTRNSSARCTCLARAPRHPPGSRTPGRAASGGGRLCFAIDPKHLVLGGEQFRRTQGPLRLLPLAVQEEVQLDRHGRPVVVLGRLALLIAGGIVVRIPSLRGVLLV